MPNGLGDEKLWLCPSLDDSADDISGNGNHGTYNGGMGTVADTSNGGTRAYDFTGTAKRIELGTSLNDAFYGDHSYSAWVRFSGDIFNAEPKQTILGSTNQTGTWVNFSYDKQTNSGYGGLVSFADDGVNNGQAYTNATTTYWLETDDWYHISAVRDYTNNNVYYYLDGTLTHTISFTANAITSMTQDLFIGYSGLYGYAGNTSSSGVNIYYDDIRVFDRALTTTEITHLATSRGIEGSPYDFNGLGDEKLWLCPSLDDSADDISGNGNHGTYNGGMGTVADTSNGGTRAYSFDGSNDYIDTTLSGIADFGSRSVTGWCNFSSVSGIQYFMNWYDSVGGSDPRSLYILIYQSTHWFGWKNNSSSLRVTGGTPATGWKHYSYVHDASAGTAKIYIDGTLVASGSIANTTFGNDFAEIGRVSIPSSTVYTQFESDDIRVFDRALTTSEITALASKRGYEVPSVSTTYHPFAALNHPLAQ